MACIAATDLKFGDSGRGQRVEEQAGLCVAYAGDRADTFENKVELREAAAAELDDEVPGSGGGVESFDLGVAPDFADDFLAAIGLGDDGGDAAHGVAVDVIAESDGEALDDAGVDEPVDARSDGGPVEAEVAIEHRDGGAAVGAQDGDQTVV